MGNLYLDAYKFYKRTHANSLLLFHVGSRYEACEEDAVKLSEKCGYLLLEKDGIKLCGFPDNEVSEVMVRLSSDSVNMYIVEYRDDCGNFAIPKVKQIMEDIEADY